MKWIFGSTRSAKVRAPLTGTTLHARSMHVQEGADSCHVKRLRPAQKQVGLLD